MYLHVPARDGSSSVLQPARSKRKPTDPESSAVTKRRKEEDGNTPDQPLKMTPRSSSDEQVTRHAWGIPTPDSGHGGLGSQQTSAAAGPPPSEKPRHDAFALLCSRRKQLSMQGPSSKKSADWTAEEDRVVMRGAREGWSMEKILAELPGIVNRSASAVRGRKRLLALSCSDRKQLSKQAPRSKTSQDWTAEEDRVVMRGAREGWSMEKIMAELPGIANRSASAVRGRKRLLAQKQKAARPSPNQSTIVLRRADREVVSNVPGSQDSVASTSEGPRGSQMPSSGSPCGIAPRSSQEPPNEAANSPAASEPSVGNIQVSTGQRSGPPVMLQEYPRDSSHASSHLPVPQTALAGDQATDLRGRSMSHHESSSNFGQSDAGDCQRERLRQKRRRKTHRSNRSRDSESSRRQSVSVRADAEPAEAVTPAAAPAATRDGESGAPRVVVTLPHDKSATSMFRDRTHQDRVKEAMVEAHEDPKRARELVLDMYNNEETIDALMMRDGDELNRLRAQRRRRERERAVAAGRPPPKRRGHLPSRHVVPSDRVESADESVNREDDWTTDEECGREYDESPMLEDEEEVLSEPGTSEEDLEDERLVGITRVEEIEDSPAPSVMEGKMRESSAPRVTKECKHERLIGITRVEEMEEPPAPIVTQPPRREQVKDLRTLYDEQKLREALAEFKRREVFCLGTDDDDDDESSSFSTNSDR